MLKVFRVATPDAARVRSRRGLQRADLRLCAARLFRVCARGYGLATLQLLRGGRGPARACELLARGAQRSFEGRGLCCSLLGLHQTALLSIVNAAVS